ncbi:MAG: hypothetical protein ABI904_02195 [Chloroflexota bacterium]
MTVDQPINPNSNRENQFSVVRKKLLSPLPSDTKQGIDQIRQWLIETPEDQDTYDLVLGIAKESPTLTDEIYSLLQGMASKGSITAKKTIGALDGIMETPTSNIGESDPGTQSQTNTQLSTEQLLMNQAEDAYYAAEFEKAIPLYQQVLQLQPDNQRAKQQLDKAELNRYTGKPGSYIPRDAMKYYRQARSFIAAKDFNAAINLLSVAVEEAHTKGVEFREANMALNRLQDLLTATQYIAKAETFVQSGNWENALDQYKKALTLDPSDESSLKMRDGLQGLLSAEALLDPLGIQLSAQKSEKLESIGNYLKETEKTKELVNIDRYQQILAKHTLYKAELDLHSWGVLVALAPQSRLFAILQQSKSILGAKDPAVIYVEEQLRLFKPVRILLLLLLATIIILVVFQLLSRKFSATPPIVSLTLTPTLTSSFTKTVQPTNTIALAPTKTATNTSAPTITATASLTSQPDLDAGFVNKFLIHPQDKPNGKWVGELGKPQPVTVLEQEVVGGVQWFFCEWNINGTIQQGWILSEYIIIIENSKATSQPTFQPIDAGYVNTGLIHPQDGPNGKWVGKLNRFQFVTVLKQQISSGDQWYFCQWQVSGINQQGWILAKYITIGSPPIPQPTLTP